MAHLRPLTEFNLARFETVEILKRLNSANKALAELKGVAAAIPNPNILINTLWMQEAKDSSEIELIVTTHEEVFSADAAQADEPSPAVKEVLGYRRALRVGFEGVRKHGLLTTNQIIAIQELLELNNAGLRRVPGTVLKDGEGRTVYTPPQDYPTILELMTDLERFINTTVKGDLDPLIKMAVIHHQFESIHPFHDGNGRTGRIVNVLYLVMRELLDTPVLYLSGHIVRTKPQYYRLMRAVQTEDAWEAWILYMLEVVEASSQQTRETIQSIMDAYRYTKRAIRDTHRFYSLDLVNNLFAHPFTRSELLMRDLGITRPTATRYLDALSESGILSKRKSGRNVFYVNDRLYAILADTKKDETV